MLRRGRARIASPWCEVHYLLQSSHNLVIIPHFEGHGTGPQTPLSKRWQGRALNSSLPEAEPAHLHVQGGWALGGGRAPAPLCLASVHPDLHPKGLLQGTPSPRV